MQPNHSLMELMHRLQCGDDAAADRLFKEYSQRLIGLTRAHLDQRYARKVDPEDIVQSAYKSFYIRHREGAFQIGSWDGLWGLLTLITLRKCADRIAYYRTDKRDIHREQNDHGGDDNRDTVTYSLSREPSPDEVTLLAETVEELFRGIHNADERHMLELSLQGYTTAEICETTGRAERSVRRLRERTRKRLERMQKDTMKDMMS